MIVGSISSVIKIFLEARNHFELPMSLGSIFTENTLQAEEKVRNSRWWPTTTTIKASFPLCIVGQSTDL